MQSTQKTTANDFPLYLFHQGKNFLVHTRSDEAEDSSIVSASGHLTPRVYLSSVHSTNGIAPVTRCTRSLTRYGRQSCPD